MPSFSNWAFSFNGTMKKLRKQNCIACHAEDNELDYIDLAADFCIDLKKSDPNDLIRDGETTMVMCMKCGSKILYKWDAIKNNFIACSLASAIPKV